MKLYEQMIALGYHLIIGQIYGLFFSFLSICCISVSTWIRMILYSVFSLICTGIYYYGLYKINGGMIHIYLLCISFIGLYLYYHFFYEHLLPFFYIVIRPIQKKMQFAKKKICAIISRQRDKRRRRAIKNEQKKKVQKDQLSR